MKKPTKKIEWFARGGGILRTGPFPTQIAATNAIRLVKRPAEVCIASDCRNGQVKLNLVEIPAQEADFPPDVFVWPEEIQE